MSVYFKTSATMKLPSTDPDKVDFTKISVQVGRGGEEGGTKKSAHDQISFSVHCTHKTSTYSYKTR